MWLVILCIFIYKSLQGLTNFIFKTFWEPYCRAVKIMEKIKNGISTDSDHVIIHMPADAVIPRRSKSSPVHPEDLVEGIYIPLLSFLKIDV